MSHDVLGLSLMSHTTWSPISISHSAICFCFVFLVLSSNVRLFLKSMYLWIKWQDQGEFWKNWKNPFLLSMFEISLGFSCRCKAWCVDVLSNKGSYQLILIKMQQQYNSFMSLYFNGIMFDSAVNCPLFCAFSPFACRKAKDSCFTTGLCSTVTQVQVRQLSPPACYNTTSPASFRPS